MKEKALEFWNNKTEEEKRKIIVYSVAGVLCTFLLLIGFLLYKPDKNEKVNEITNPDASEAKKYNSRTEANQMGKVDSLRDFNTGMNEIFGTEQQTTSVETPTYSQPNYDTYSTGSGSGSGGQSTYTPPSYSAPEPQRQSGNYNSHNTYGDYSMWQAEEPKNNSIGYTDVKTYPKKNGKSNNTQSYSEPTYTEVPAQLPSMSGQQGNEISRSAKKIKAKLLSTGFATNGRSLSFIMLEPTTINGEQTKKGQVITGVAKIMGDRLTVKFGSLKINGKNIAVNGSIVGFDGEDGMPISGENEGGGMSGAGGYIKDQAVSQASRIPVVGGLINSVSSGSGRTQQDKVKLNQNTDCIIAIY